MSNNSIEKNNNFDNLNIHNSVNTSNKSNLKLNQKGAIPEHLIFFKEDVLKDIKQLESKIYLKYDIQYNISSNKINKLESIAEQLSQRIDYLSSSITEDHSLKERIEKLSNSFSKLDETMVLQDVRIKNNNQRLTETIDKFNKLFSETVIYPGVIGQKAKYKTFHEFIDFVLFSLNQLLMFKDKISMDFKEYKYKTDSMMSNFQIKLDYLTKNSNAFTTSSIKVSEKKLETIIRSKMDDFRNEFDEFKNKYDAFSGVPQDKIKNIIENSEKPENPKLDDENSKKIENLELLIESLKEENKKMRKEINKITSINETPNTNIITNHNNNYNNNLYDKIITKKKIFDFNIKNATSIVKEYIKGKITESEMFPRRKSVNSQIYQDLESIKEYENINNRQSITPMKKQKKKKPSNSMEKLDDIKDISLNSKNEEFKEEEDEESESSVSYKKELNNTEKNYEFQKNLFSVSGIENDLIEREKKIYQKKKKRKSKKSIDNISANSALNYIQMSRKLYQKRKSSINNSFSNNSEAIENKEKNSIKDFKKINIINKNKINDINNNIKNDINNKINNNIDNNNINNNINSYNINNKNSNFYITTNNFNLNNNKNPNFYITNINSINANKSTRNHSNIFESNKSKENNNIFEKTKKYDNIKDIKTVINIIKKESRENLIPSLNINKHVEKTSNNNKKNNNENNGRKDKENIINNESNKKTININSRNQKDNNLEESIKKYSKTKGEYSKIKLINTPSKIINQKSTIGSSNLILPPYETKKLNKAISAGRFTSKSNWNNAKQIDINFKPYDENIKEKDEKKMKQIFNQMKDFLSSDEKALIKERFAKYGYNKEKIFINEIKKKLVNEEDINYNINGIYNKRNNYILRKNINYDKK